MILHIFLSPFKRESRVLKECQAWSELRWDKSIMVAALWEPGLKYEEQIGDSVTVWRVALRTRGWPKHLLVQMLKYFEWACKIISRMRTEDLTVIHAHRISAIPVGVVLKWLTGAPVVYDAHELESETNGLSPLRSKLSRWMEGLWIRGVDRTVTVCDSIAGWYADAYSIERPTVIRNVPLRAAAPTENSTVLRDSHNIPDDALLYLYQGSLSPGRGVSAIIEIFANINPQRHLVFMGYGVLEDQAREAASINPNIHFQPAVPPDRVLAYTASADIGLCLFENTCLNHYYSLPNKLFEYLISGLPVLVSDMPEQRNIVTRFRCGWVVRQSLEQQMALVESIDTKELEVRKTGAVRASETLNWENEAGKLRDLYVAIAGDASS